MSRNKVTLKDRWENHYTAIIPIFASIGCIALRKSGYPEWFYGQNISDALGSVIAAVSIIISLFGVMLTLLAEARHSSQIVKAFFQNVDRSFFVKELKLCIWTGFLSIALSTVMFFVKENGSWFSILFFSAWFSCLVALLCRAYRFISLIITMLFIGKNENEAKAEQEKRKEQANNPNSNIKSF